MRGSARTFAVLLCVFAPAPVARAGIVISEIHYHPPVPDGKDLEFVELHNPDGSPVPLAGWRLAGAIRHRFGPGSVVASGGRVVVAREPAALRAAYGDRPGILGPYEGDLDDAGGRVSLLDADRAVVDEVRWDDEAPWASFADGSGASLQRLCAGGPSWRPDNWGGAPVDAPTPLDPPGRGDCPLPAPEVPGVVMSEIHYHPVDDRDALEEYVELYNRSGKPVDLSGWRFIDGIEFVFSNGTVLEAGERIVVCRDAEHVRRALQAENAVGDFMGRLSNRGERLALLDDRGRTVDVVSYRDQGLWSWGADGEGRSLEKVDLDLPSHDPAAWSHSALQVQGFVHLEAVGKLPDLLTQQVVLGIDGAGEFVVDNLALEQLDRPGENLIQAGDFEEEFDEHWRLRGNAQESRVEEGIGVGGSRGLRVVSTGGCQGECSASDSVVYRFARGVLDREPSYRLSLDFRLTNGSPALYARVLGGLEIDFLGLNLTPGAPNTSTRGAPPFVSRRGRFPEQPTPADPVWLTAHVRPVAGAEPTTVRLQWWRGDIELSDPTSVLLEDDGLHRDGVSGDGVYGGRLPPQAHDAQVHYRILVEDSTGETTTWPRPLDPSNPGPAEVWGYYVNDKQPDSDLPVYHVLVPGADPEIPEQVNDELNCEVLRDGAFAYRGELWPRVGIRWRGNTACWVKKRNFKLKFPRGRDFRDARKINLQGLWTDKSLVREHLAWELVGELGLPSVETEYIRVHLNGQYHGLFLFLEHPDQRWLRKWPGLDDEGCLYKARQPPRDGQQPRGVAWQPTVQSYESFWERETCESRDLTELAGFIDELHTADGLTAGFMAERVFEEWTIGYQVAQVLLNNIDSFAKNHFLYSPPGGERWALFPWDLDLVFGKFFNPAVVDRFPDGERPVGTLNDCMLSDVGGDLNPWFTTRVNQNTLLHHFVNRFFLAGNGRYQRAYLVRLRNAIVEKYRVDAYEPVLRRLEDRLGEEAAEDLERWGRYESNPECPVPDGMEENIDILVDQLRKHRRFLLNYIDLQHPSIQDHPRLKVTEILYDAPGAGEELEFVEILNVTGREVDLSGWALTGGVRLVFPGGTLLGPDRTMVLASDPELLALRYPGIAGSVPILGPWDGRLANGTETLRLIDTGPGFPATIDLVRYRSGGEWPEVPDGHSIELADVSPESDNDPPEAWRVSARSGGTPGSVAPAAVEFVRGDADGSGTVNLTDSISVLDWLFRSGTPPVCPDAADADDDGVVRVNDPVFVLNWLFLSGDPPRAPWPEEGPDPTEDDLDCG